jgi:hypothetical protein
LGGQDIQEGLRESGPSARQQEQQTQPHGRGDA